MGWLELLEEQSSDDLRFASAVAMFGMLLRESPFKSEASYDLAFDLARQSIGDDPQGYRSEFVRLISQARDLASTREPAAQLGMLD